jgi:hypothetical protein
MLGVLGPRSDYLYLKVPEVMIMNTSVRLTENFKLFRFSALRVRKNMAERGKNGAFDF